MCIFCDIADHKIPSKIVYEDDDVIAILDMSQVTYGHTLVMPKKHVRSILEANEETVKKCAAVAAKLAKQIVANTGAAGCNILSNCGEAAGQSVDHMHFHIIPRYGKEDPIDFNPFKESPKQDLDQVLAKVKG
jgi:histidine triad (HIT) family protein